MAHPHVERAVEPEREAALGLVELHRGDADIHHDAVDLRRRLARRRPRRDWRTGPRPASAGRRTARPDRSRRRSPCGRGRCRSPGCRRLSRIARLIAAGAEGGVDIDAAVARARAARPPRGRARRYGDGLGRAHRTASGAPRLRRGSWTRTAAHCAVQTSVAIRRSFPALRRCRQPAAAAGRSFAASRHRPAEPAGIPGSPHGICWAAMGFRASERASAVPKPVRLFTPQ